MLSAVYCVPTVPFGALDPVPAPARVANPLGRPTETNAVD